MKSKFTCLDPPFLRRSFHSFSVLFSDVSAFFQALCFRDATRRRNIGATRGAFSRSAPSLCWIAVAFCLPSVPRVAGRRAADASTRPAYDWLATYDCPTPAFLPKNGGRALVKKLVRPVRLVPWSFSSKRSLCRSGGLVGWRAGGESFGAFCKEPMGCEWNVPLPAEQRKEDEAEDCPTVQDKVTIAAVATACLPARLGSAECARQSSIQRTSKASEAQSWKQTRKQAKRGFSLHNN